MADYNSYETPLDQLAFQDARARQKESFFGRQPNRSAVFVRGDKIIGPADRIRYVGFARRGSTPDDIGADEYLGLLRTHPMTAWARVLRCESGTVPYIVEWGESNPTPKPEPEPDFVPLPRCFHCTLVILPDDRTALRMGMAVHAACSGSPPTRDIRSGPEIQTAVAAKSEEVILSWSCNRQAHQNTTIRAGSTFTRLSEAVTYYKARQKLGWKWAKLSRKDGTYYVSHGR